MIERTDYDERGRNLTYWLEHQDDDPPPTLRPLNWAEVTHLSRIMPKIDFDYEWRIEPRVSLPGHLMQFAVHNRIGDECFVVFGVIAGKLKWEVYAERVAQFDWRDTDGVTAFLREALSSEAGE